MLASLASLRTTLAEPAVDDCQLVVKSLTEKLTKVYSFYVVNLKKIINAALLNIDTVLLEKALQYFVHIHTYEKTPEDRKSRDGDSPLPQ